MSIYSVLKQLTDERASVVEKLVDGHWVKTFDEYRQKVGEIVGLDNAITAIREDLKKTDGEEADS